MRTFPTINTRYEHVNNFINTLAPVVCNAWVKYRREGQKTISPAVILAQAAKESVFILKNISEFLSAHAQFEETVKIV